jgi:hypothetical protein
MKWTEQLLGNEKLFGWLLTKDDNSSKVISNLINFNKNEINVNYVVYKDNLIPTLIKI